MNIKNSIIGSEECFYILDAQGNVMSTYNLNIDTVNTSLTYFQAEKYIYGSSRLGMLKDSVNVLGSAYANTDTSNFVHTLGNKRYELSNHLGNVLTVISDKPIPHNNGGMVDYWQADIKSAYDYSPFGVMLTGRTFEGRETVCHDSTVQATQNALEEGFGTWGSWTAMADGLVTYVADEMQVSNPSTSKKNIGASKTFTTGEGLHSVSFVVIGNMCSNIVIWPPSSTPIPINVSVKDNLGNVVASGNYTAAGSYNLSFTPASAGLTYRIEFYMANASAFCFFRADDVLVSYEDESVVTVCREVENSYLYGFQGQLRDDEIKGKGNSVNYTYRMHDTRLGRFFAVDPLTKDYPWYTPYSFSGNRVIDCIELEGLEEFSIHLNNGRLFLKLDKIDVDFVVNDYSSGTLVERKIFYYKNLVQQMKGMEVDKHSGVLYVPNSNSSMKIFDDPNDMPGSPNTPNGFSTSTNDRTLATKKPIEGSSFIASNFTTAADAFNAYPMEEPTFHGDVFISDKILPDIGNYDYVDVYISPDYSRDDILNQLGGHGVDLSNKEINFIDRPYAKESEGKALTIEVTFGTYE